MAGTYDLFDSTQYTSDSEYDSRYGVAIRYLQIHHATMTSLSGLISLMQPGGREVSANGALGNDGHLVEVVPATQRAFTSGVASWDRQCITVESCNTSLSPTWGISAATRTRLAKLAVGMYRLGLLGGLTRQFIIGHYEVPGTYATACPGPDMHLDAIVAEANAIYNGGGSLPEGYDDMIMILAVDDRKGRPWRMLGPGYDRLVPEGHSEILKASASKVLEINAAQYDIIRANWVQASLGATAPVTIPPVVIDQKQLDAAIAAALDGYAPPPAPPVEVAIDYKLIAKAVNDDAAKRLAE